MGGEGSGRKPSEETIVNRMTEQRTPIGDDVWIPNYSGLQPVKKTDVAILKSGDNVSSLMNDAGYITSYAETDPVFMSLSGSFYLASNPSGYISSYTETDPKFMSLSGSLNYLPMTLSGSIAVGGDVTGTTSSIQIDHVSIASIGTNTHPQIDTFISTPYLPMSLSGSTAISNNAIIHVSGSKYYGNNSLLTISGSNVGIGTATPSATLQVNGTIMQKNLFIADGGDIGLAGTYILYPADGLNLTFLVDSGKVINFINSAGTDLKVGIGTTSPGSTLDVNGDFRANNFVGVITMFGGSTAPNGWLLCDNSAVSRATYAALYAIIGTTYGVGDGSTTFNVPDMRGVFPRGAGTSAKLTNANGTAFAGTLGTYQNDKGQGHIHTFAGNSVASGVPSNNTTAAGSSHNHAFTGGALGGHAHSITLYTGTGYTTTKVPKHLSDGAVYGTAYTSSDSAGTPTGSNTAEAAHTHTMQNHTHNTTATGTISNPSTDGTNGVPRTGLETNPANLGLTFIIKY